MTTDFQPSNSNLDPESAIQIADRIWWVGHRLPGDPFQCHVYLIENGDQSVLIDPGSKLTFHHALSKIEDVLPFKKIRYFLCHHQDPDITGALPLIDTLISRDDAVIVSHWRAIALLKHYGLNLPFLCIEKNQWTLDLGGRKLDFIFTPYLHFPGAFCTFDRQSGTLFSSDIFGGFTEDWQLYAEDESYFEAIRPFHEHYMPSREILYHGLSKLEEYPLTLIAPQHGSIIPKSLIPFMINQLKNIDCGLYLMTQTSSDINRLTKLNQILRSFMQSMVNYKTFREIANTCLKQIQQILPVSMLAFYTQKIDETTLLLRSDAMFKAIPCELPEVLEGMIGSTINDWQQRFNSDMLYSSERPLTPQLPAGECALSIPLIDQHSGRILAVAILHTPAEFQPDDESLEVLRQMSVPLSVAVEREMIFRSMETERQKFYEQSIRDPLTNLYTRLYMREAAQRLFSIHDRDKNAALCIIALDIDYFKQVNDNFGHNAGDEVIKNVADIISHETREGDIQVRLGGEEFAAFVVSNDRNIVVEIAERIRTKIEALRFTGPMKDHRISISAGVITREQGETLTAALHRADMALYQAKNSGRNRVCIDL